MLNKDATPVIWDLTSNMNPIVHAGKIATVFGSYGWSGEGVDFIFNRFNDMKLKTLQPLKIKFKPSEIQLIELYKFGNDIGETIISKEMKK